MVSAIEPLLRAKLMMALAGLVVLGIGMLALVILGGRFARRVARTPLPPSRMHDDRWYAKPLVPQHPEQPSNDGDEREPGRPSDSHDADGASPEGPRPDEAGPDEPGPGDA